MADSATARKLAITKDESAPEGATGEVGNASAVSAAGSSRKAAGGGGSSGKRSLNPEIKALFDNIQGELSEQPLKKTRTDGQPGSQENADDDDEPMHSGEHHGAMDDDDDNAGGI